MIDMQGTLDLRHRVEQLAHAGRAILRLLHRQRDQIVVGRIDRAGAGGRQLAGQLARIDLDQAVAALDRHAHAGAFLVDQLRLGGQADQLDRVPGEQQFGRQQRAVRRPQDDNPVRRVHRKLPRVGQQTVRRRRVGTTDRFPSPITSSA